MSQRKHSYTIAEEGVTQMLETKPLRAMKAPGYIIEPILTGYSRKWEGHHATNPSALRLSNDPRVFLGYRAGGDDDHYYLNTTEVWGSSLGLAVLDPLGEKVEARLPLPIMKIKREIPLPQSPEEYEEYMQEHADEIVVLHDFRLFEYGDYLYVIYHDGKLNQVYDCVRRMQTATFLAKVADSLELMSCPVEDILGSWECLWWADSAWEPCGVNGTRLIYGSKTQKNDIVFLQLADGTLQMNHRPLPDIAVLNTGTNVCAEVTPDGIAAYGSLETCVRPGYFDNSHIGCNGTPTRARIGDVDVYVDVTHGVHNESISSGETDTWKMTYLPYFRVKDVATGELLYYSEEPILVLDEMWKEYVEEGTWVSGLPHLLGVMFAGGQVEVESGKNGLDDLFAFYTGVGDTAVARATFRLRDLLPDRVIRDILCRREHQEVIVDGIDGTEYHFPHKISGWEWSMATDTRRRHLNIKRRLIRGGLAEEGCRVVNTVPGNFDADGVIFDGKSLRHLDEIGWALVYKGIRWDENEQGAKTTAIGYGVLVFDDDNPEKILYRSTEPIGGQLEYEEGWTATASHGVPTDLLTKVEDFIPEKVKYEIKRTKYLISKGYSFASDMTAWLRQKSGYQANTHKNR